MKEPTLASLSSEPGVILSGDATTVIYRDADGTARAFQARADDPDFLAWQRDQRERPGATTVEVDGVSLEADLDRAIADIRNATGIEISRTEVRRVLHPREEIDMDKLVRDMRDASGRDLVRAAREGSLVPQQNRHERRANAAIGRRR